MRAESRYSVAGPRTSSRSATARQLVALVTAASLVSGCAVRNAPRGWVPYAQDAAREAYGGWIQLELAGQTSTPLVTGELLAVSEDSIYTLRDTVVTAVPVRSLGKATLEYYDPRSGDVGQIVLAGTLLTFTHGWWLIITAPLWIIVGTPSAAVLSHDGMVNVSADDSMRAGKGRRVPTWRDLRLHARFPQGLPAELDRTALHERPLRSAAKPHPWPGSIVPR